jgi:hypothetical protein
VVVLEVLLIGGACGGGGVAVAVRSRSSLADGRNNYLV